MTIKALVDRGLELHALIAKAEAELKTIEAKLTDVALYKDQVELADPDREGRRYLAKGTDRIVPVIFTADKLTASFMANSSKHLAILGASYIGQKNYLARFYGRVEKYEAKFDDGKKFRAAAAEILGPNAPAFITACLARDKHGIPKSDTKIIWDDAEPIAKPSAATEAV